MSCLADDATRNSMGSFFNSRSADGHVEVQDIFERCHGGPRTAAELVVLPSALWLYPPDGNILVDALL